MATPNCPTQTYKQTWTCQGDTYFFSNIGGPGQYSAKLTDSSHMVGVGNGIVATRITPGLCPSGAQKKNQARRCQTPPPGKTVRDKTWGLCVEATNTNTLPQCKLSFKYVSSINGELNGEIVEPGKTGRACVARPGETVTFARWVDVSVPAR